MGPRVFRATPSSTPILHQDRRGGEGGGEGRERWAPSPPPRNMSAPKPKRQSSFRVVNRHLPVAESSPSPKEVEEFFDCRTPPLTPPWETSDDSLTFEDSSYTHLSSLLDGNTSKDKKSRRTRASSRASLKRKSKIQVKTRTTRPPDKGDATDELLLDSDDKNPPLLSPPTTPSSRTGSGGTSSIFLSSLSESEVIFFPPPDSGSSTPKKKKQEKPEGGTIAALRANLAKDEEEQRAKGNLELKAATPMVLLSYLCSPLATKKFNSAFLLTFPTFMSSNDLFDGLLLALIKSGVSEEKIDMIHHLFHQWMTRFFKEDWNKELQDKFLHFLQTQPGEPFRDSPLSPLAPSSPISFPSFSSFSGSPLSENRPSLKAHMKSCEEAAAGPRTSFPLSFKPSPPFQAKKEGEEVIDVHMFEEDDIVHSLTLYSFAIFKEIREREFLATEKEDSPHITQLISLFNHISMWVTSEIVTRTKLSDRVALIVKFTNIAVKLFGFQNHLMTLSVVSGLTKSCVKRMTKTLAAVPPGTLTTINDLETQLSASTNFKAYRSILDRTTPPCIPYLGMFQKDLIFMNDGNPNQIGGLINFSKRSRVFEIVLDISLCQYGDYGALQHNTKFLTWVMNDAHMLSEKEQFLWSRRIDPKDTEMVIAEFIEGELDYLARIEALEEELRAEKEKNDKLKDRMSKMLVSTPSAPSTSSAVGLPSASGWKMRDTPRTRYQRTKTLPFSLLQFRSMRMETSSVSQPSKWSVHEVVNWVKECVGENWGAVFEENQILGADLVEMEKEDLYMYVEDSDVCEKLYNSIQTLVTRVNVLIPSKPLTFDPVNGDSGVESSPIMDSPHLYRDESD